MESEKHLDKKRYGTISFFVNNDMEIAKSIVVEYLQERKTFSDEPSGVIYVDDLLFGEYYLSEDKERLSTVLYMWNLELDQSSLVLVSCSTFNFSDFEMKGFISYDYDEEAIVREEVYDTNYKLVGGIEYENNSRPPFDIISNVDIMSDYESLVFESINTHQKLWIQNELSEFDDLGNLIDYNGDIFYPNSLDDNISFKYDKNDRLNGFVGTRTNNEFYDTNDESKTYTKPLDYQFYYDNNGLMDFSTYYKPGLIYGTYDSKGMIRYDDKGRMVFNDFYITHGSINKFYFYNEDEVRPYMIMTWDSMPKSGWEEDEVEYIYGNFISIYLFEEYKK